MFINYNQGLPLYWREETSGKLASAFEWYLNLDEVAAVDSKVVQINLNLLKVYVVQYLRAPCWVNHEGVSANYLDLLERTIKEAEEIATPTNLTQVLTMCLNLGIDPF